MKKYENLAKAIYDIGKYAFIAIVVGQFISEKFDWLFMCEGIVFSILLFWLAFKLEHIKNGNNG